MLSRLVLKKTVLIAFDGGERDEFENTLLFKPPFGPYPKELKETFPIGPSEIPEWDEAMVRQGLKGVRNLIKTHPDSRFTIACNARWEPLVRQELGDIEVRHDPV
jgi:7-cyano-7-deazaguanine tRNA-ribosyltransferase